MLDLLSLSVHKWQAKESYYPLKEGIKKLVRKVWRAVTPEYLKNIYSSMSRRMAAVIVTQGGHTKY